MTPPDRILSHLRQLERSGQPAPTYRDLAEACDISSLSEVKRHLDTLAARGLVAREENKARTLRTTEYQGELEQLREENKRLNLHVRRLTERLERVKLKLDLDKEL